MAPKAPPPPADPAEAIIAAIAAADGASGAAKASALEPLVVMLNEPEKLPIMLEKAVSIFQVAAAVYAEAALTPAESATPESAQAVDTATKLVNGLCEAGAGSVALATCGASLMSIPSMSTQPALQAQAALALSRLAEAPMCRASFGAPDKLPLLLALLEPLATALPAADAPRLRARSKVLLLLGFCLYDGALLPALIEGGLVDAALALLKVLPVEPDAPPLSAEAIQCAAELRSNAATVLAIAGQSLAGRRAIVAAGGLHEIVYALGAPGAPCAIAGGAAAASKDAASAALIANLTLGVAHMAIDGAAAVTMASVPTTLPALVALLAPPTEGCVPGWSAVRGNACTALLHLVHQPSGRVALLAPPPSPSTSVGEVDAPDAAPESKDDSAAAAGIETVVALLANPLSALQDSGLLATAADIVGQCASEASGRETLMAAGAATALLSFFDASQPPALLEAAAAAFAALASHPTACAMLKGPPAPASSPETAPEDAAPESKEGGELDEAAAPPPPPPPPPIAIAITLLAHALPSMQRAGCSLVQAACSDAVSAGSLIKLGALPLLQQLTVATGAASGAPGAAVATEPLSLAAAARASILAICNAVPAAQLWYKGSIPLSLPTSDGFYGCTRDTAFLALEDLATSNAGPEVLSVDAADDPPLAALITSARALLQTHAKKGATPAALASTLATFVCQQMGGAVEYLEYEYYTEPEEQLAALRVVSGTRVVPLGEVKAGATRHRALLFKVLCDKLGLQASYEMGACVRGAHAHHAWNTMILNRKEVLVDVMHAPGTLHPLGSDAARRYMRIDEFAFASLQSTYIKRTEPLPAGTAVDATSAKQYYDGLFGDAVPPPPKCKA
ncbi:armadillo repeat-containing protein 3-like protein [Chrysochromulina tobinii]|uniref:Armadillo repeat-containing protein 3-like protein n=1 Tax=Chrysochromulina tobinii TaxID=1460289 RepID=A0A0M0J3M5_9EUKA|nr:armadillo repeat-containing protein 3-like protein [Chrysochromulina tobinii]|eukprot:KOO21174.1 armadillo repeat-containing protein 3-like protein [Chrysochromulina sp. CCMP291]